MVFVGIETVYRSESKTQVVNFLVKMIKAMGRFLEILCYDDMCHLASFIHNRVHVNDNMGFLYGLRKYVDRFHLRNHRNEECKKTYNSDSDPTLAGVNTEVCEQTNAWLIGFQSTVRQMNPERFKVFMLYMCHLKNKQFEKMCAPGASGK
jgi:hypothetical protein